MTCSGPLNEWGVFVAFLKAYRSFKGLRWLSQDTPLGVKPSRSHSDNEWVLLVLTLWLARLDTHVLQVPWNGKLRCWNSQMWTHVCRQADFVVVMIYSETEARFLRENPTFPSPVFPLWLSVPACDSIVSVPYWCSTGLLKHVHANITSLTMSSPKSLSDFTAASRLLSSPVGCHTTRLDGDPRWPSCTARPSPSWRWTTPSSSS